MVAIVPITEPIRAEVAVPGSKSLTNRALVVASLAEGSSHLTNVLHSDDTRYMLEHLCTLGASAQVSDHAIDVAGTGGAFQRVDASCYCGNAGTTVRFLTALCALAPGTQTITGDARMQTRPLSDLVEALTALGAEIEASNGCPPVTVRSGVLRGGHVPVRASRSSQYLSALLMAAPYAEQPVTLEVVGELVSQPYIDLTLDVMAAFGVSVDRDGHRRFRITPQRYQGGMYAVEGDATSAGYWWALAAVSGSQIRVANVPADSHQGDIALVRIFEQMGCQVGMNGGIAVQGPAVLRSPGTVDMNSLPDGVMTLAVVAALAEGETRIVNVGNLRIKESDRLAALVTELRRVGIDASELPDGLRIRGGRPHGATIETYADHRMAMSFAILGTRVPGISIEAPECVSKSYPLFFQQLHGLHPATPNVS